MSLALAGQIAAPILQAGIGAWQLYKQSQIKDERPQFEIPEAYQQALAQSKQLAYGDMPGEELARQRIGQGTSQAVGQMRDAGVVDANAIARSAAMGQQQEASLGANMTSQRASWRNNYSNALNRMGQMQMQEWQLNEYEPYQNAMAQKSAFLGAGLQNVMGAAKSVGSYYQGQDYQNFMQGLYGGNAQGNPQPPPQPSIQNQGSWFNDKMYQNWFDRGMRLNTEG